MKDSIELRVAEARTRDVGRGIARIDPKDMEKMDVSIGDVIELAGKRNTAAKAMPAYMEERGKGIVQIDGIIRENAQVGLDEKVNMRKVAYKPAESIILSPLTLMRSSGADTHARYIGRLLEGLPLVQGDRVRANLFGARSCDFMVTETYPKDAVLIIAPTTTIRLKLEKGEEGRPEKISYEDIGGLHKEIQRIREMIELPLKYPQVFERLGISAPKGVFLHGPPGCGKTLIARAVANETDAHFLHLSGPEIMHKFYGESEAHLRNIFEEAKANAPSIIFLDELDAMAPKREEMGGEKQVERRVVAQLLALMDGLESRGQVIVIGATNIPNTIDPALRRPGRFDREISIPIPDRNGRLEILQIHTRGMPLGADVDLKKLADITHGFVGADLEVLCKEAAMITLRTIMPKIDFSLDELPYDVISELEVSMKSFLEAFQEIDPSAIREVFVEIPDVKWDEVGGLDDVKRNLVETVEWPLQYGKLFEHAKTEPPTGILLSGASGTGKTLLAKALATESGVNFISVKGPELMSRYVGESERAVREVFRKARQAAPCILFLDEVDSLVPRRGGGAGDSQVTQRVISQFLTELDGIEKLKGVVVLAATNRIDIIDPAILRAGRFDLILSLPLPEKGARQKILEIHTRDKPLDQDVNLASLAGLTKGFSGADLEAVVRRASMLAIRHFLSEKKDGASDQPLDYSQFRASMAYFKRAIAFLQEQKAAGKAAPELDSHNEQE